MPRIRSIKPEFCVSDQIVECSTSARLLFVLMWMFCDDRGIHPVSFSKLKAECFPADPFTPDQIRVWINELIRARLIGRFSSQGIDFWQVTGWKHQKIDRPSFKFPEAESLFFDEHSSNTRRTLVDGHPPESKGVESKGVSGGDAPEVLSSRSLPAKPLKPSQATITTTHVNGSDGSKIWDSYLSAYLGKYGTEPVRNAKTNSLCAQIAKRLPAGEAPQVAAFYLTLPYYLPARHPVANLLRDCEGIRTQWATGVKATKLETRSAEQVDSVNEQIRRVGASLEAGR